MYQWFKLYTVPFFVSGQNLQNQQRDQIIISPTVGHENQEVMHAKDMQPNIKISLIKYSPLQYFCSPKNGGGLIPKVLCFM